MAAQNNIGILGIGVFLPEQVRSNDWWPKEVVASWTEKSQKPRPETPPVDESEALVRREIAKYANDPFRGAVERRVMAPGMTALDMEIAAGREALSRSGLGPADISMVLVQSSIQDYLTTNTAVSVHAALGLPRDCFSLMIEAACNGFHMQYELAVSMIATGRARYALLIQSCSLSRVLVYDQPQSAWFGDGATAVVIGPVSEGRGMIGSYHGSDGELGNTLISGVPGGFWYDEGRCVLYPVDPGIAHKMVMRVPSYAQRTILPALERAGLSPLDVDFYASHQAFSWFRSATQEAAGLANAKSIDTFGWAGSLSSSNVPLVLALAERDGLVKDDDIIVTHAGGSGVTYSSLVLRWGR